MKNIPTAVTRLIMIGALFAMLAMVTGCRNTAQGVGQDVERAGEKIQEKTN